ncbi:hypothetical protein N0V86_009574 [Didymella sp. IMI 355093]|nr:hypothetical protein N0V86_009574 [Didymella sp. IMI 355093]
MDSTNDAIHDLFDFDAFNHNGQDVSLVADRHLFDNGSDLFSTGPLTLPDQSLNFPPSSNPVDLFAHATSAENASVPVPDREFFDNNLDLFTETSFHAGLPNFAPIDQPTPQFVAQQFGDGFDSALGPTLPALSQPPTLTIEPAMVFDHTQPPQIVLATLEEQQQWQAFKNQQTQLFQSQLQVPQLHAVQQWDDIEDQLNLGLQSPFESPANESEVSPFQGFDYLEMPQEATNPSQQNILSDEQIHLLQNAKPAEHVQSSIELPPTGAAFSRNRASSEHSSGSRSSHTGRHSSSPRTSTPEQVAEHARTPQVELARLTFTSLENAEAAMPSRYIENAWEPPSPDRTIPNTPKKRATYVLDMFEAFQDCSECKDNKNGNSYVKRWSDGPGSYYNLHAMEKVCWQMLDIAERMHTGGPQSTNLYCEEALKKLKTSRDMTFEQRIYHVCAMLRYSKFLCDQLMKGEGLEALVGAPKLKMSGATTMQVQNQRRQKWIVHGRTEDPHHANSDNNEGGEQDNDENNQLARRKTKPKTKRTPSTKPCANPKARSANISHDESDNEEESVHRRQSDTNITQLGYGSDIEMIDEPQQGTAPEASPSPLPVPHVPSSAPPAQTQTRRNRGGLGISVPASKALATSPAVTLASLVSPPTPSSPSSIASITSPAPSLPTTLKTKQSKRAISPQVRIPHAEVDAGRARWESQTRFETQKANKQRKKRETKRVAPRAADEARGIAVGVGLAKLVASKPKKTSANASKPSSNKVTTKAKTKNGKLKHPIMLMETDSEDDESAPKAKRQRTYNELFAEWMIRNDGSNEDDIREAGYHPVSRRLPDGEISDSDEHTDDNVYDNESEDEDDGTEDDANEDDEIDEDQVTTTGEDGFEQSEDNLSQPQEGGSGLSGEDDLAPSDKDNSEHPSGEDNSEHSDTQTLSRSPYSIRKRKIEKLSVKHPRDRTDQVRPLIKTSRYATKAEREAAKGK